MTIAETLKDCPKGTKLYSPLFGEVTFCGILPEGIISTSFKDEVKHFELDGRYWDYEDAECLLFPSKENRDWSTFKSSKKEFKKGDFVYRELVNGNEWVSIHCKNFGNNIISFADKRLNNSYFDLGRLPLTTYNNIKFERLATEEEKQLLLQALDKKGYIWDAEKLELRKKEYEFKPFEKVLVRDTEYNKWRADFYSHMSISENVFYCVGNRWHKCIPYEGNEHLLGTTDNIE